MKNLLILVTMCGVLLAGGCRSRCSPCGTAYSAVDVETTGLSSKNGRIVEVAIVHFCEHAVIDERSWLINPGMKIPEYAARVHGISDDMVADAPLFGEVAGEITAELRGHVFVAHNAKFDLAFLNAECQRAGATLEVGRIMDTVPIFRSWYPDAPNAKLGTIAAAAGVETSPEHRALSDSRAVAEIVILGRPGD